jgi:hypothetical protein
MDGNQRERVECNKFGRAGLSTRVFWSNLDPVVDFICHALFLVEAFFGAKLV